MDDRSIVADTAAAVIRGVQSWETWSDKVKLNENAAKKQLIAKGPQAEVQLREELREQGLGWEKCIVLEAEVLGTTIGNTGIAAKEQKMMDKFEERIKLIDALPVNRRRQAVYKQTLAMSALAYGWLFRIPRMQQLNAAAKRMGGRILRTCKIGRAHV